MFLSFFLRKLWGNLLSKLKRIGRIARISAANPTCWLSAECSLGEIQLEKYVTIFGNTVVYAANIGAYSYIQTSCRIFNCEIGRFCSIAANVTIAPGMHDIKRVTTHPAFYCFESSLPRIFVKSDKFPVFKQVSIGHDVWIGEKVIILDGVRIGNGAVIAAGAVVVKDVEPYSVVGGIPAHHIKYRFDEQTIHDLQKSEWWNFSEQWFEEHADAMLDVDQFIKVIKCSSQEV